MTLCHKSFPEKIVNYVFLVIKLVGNILTALKKDNFLNPSLLFLVKNTFIFIPIHEHTHIHKYIHASVPTWALGKMPVERQGRFEI